jgi:hypothetical protein
MTGRVNLLLSHLSSRRPQFFFSQRRFLTHYATGVQYDYDLAIIGGKMLFQALFVRFRNSHDVSLPKVDQVDCLQQKQQLAMELE